MLLPALCVLALAAVSLAAPRHDDDYIDQLLRDEMREEYDNNLSQRGTREDFGQFHDQEEYEQTAEQSQQPQSSNIEQVAGAAEQFHQSNDQQQNGAIEQFDQSNDQQQNGAIEQFDQNNDQEQNGAIEQFDQNNDQEQNGAIEQFDQNEGQKQNGAINFDNNNEQAQNGDVEQFDQNDRDQNGGIEHFDDDNETDKTTESDEGIEQQGGQASVETGRGYGSSGEQDRIHKEAIDKLFGSANTDGFQEDEHFTDVFGNKPGVPEVTHVYTEAPVVTKRPSWLHRAWSNTKQKAKHIKEKVKSFFG